MYPLSTVWNSGYKRIYLIWGLCMLLGFAYPHYYQWFVLAPLGIFGQIYKQRLSAWQAKPLLALWAVVIGIAFTLNYFILYGIILPELYPLHWAVWWLAVISIPQVITGFILKKNFQIVLGVFWLVASIVLWNAPVGLQGTFFVVALITGLPYLFIAFSKKTL